ncbi:MAG: cellulase family glycosylhydrolase [Acidobacteria bacterium]|nr:cellulase family glycosylhydrolase [Acidobacteriota bacterium]
MPSEDARFRLGINYWPIRQAMGMWTPLDRGETGEDFARIAEAGFDCVRIFLLWEDFQPEPGGVSSEHLDDLVAVADAAREAGLSLMPTLFTGHMSGANWVPAWALDRSRPCGRFRTIAGGRAVMAGIRNWYEDEEVGQAQALLAREAARALSGHPALWAWDLGNEPSNCVLPPSTEHARRWLDTMTEALSEQGPAAPVTLGLHQQDLEEDRLLGPREAAASLAFASMHGYPAYATWSRHGADDGVPLFLGLLTRWLSGQEVLLAEFGAPTRPGVGGDVDGLGLLEENEAAAYTGRVLESLHRFGFLGALLWCFGNYDPALRDQPPFDEAPHEMSFGLWRADGSAKPALQVVRAFGAREKTTPRVDLGWIDVTQEEYVSDPARHLERLYAAFTAGSAEPGREGAGTLPARRRG